MQKQKSFDQDEMSVELNEQGSKIEQTMAKDDTEGHFDVFNHQWLYAGVVIQMRSVLNFLIFFYKKISQVQKCTKPLTANEVIKTI